MQDERASEAKSRAPKRVPKERMHDRMLGNRKMPDIPRLARHFPNEIDPQAINPSPPWGRCVTYAPGYTSGLGEGWG
jgi:hypothetical protein